MSKLEKQLEAECRGIAKESGLLLPKWVSPGNSGVPDRMLIGDDAYLVFMEFKRPGEKPTAIQARWQAKLKQRGHDARIIRTVAEFTAALPGPRG